MGLRRWDVNITVNNITSAELVLTMYPNLSYKSPKAGNKSVSALRVYRKVSYVVARRVRRTHIAMEINRPEKSSESKPAACAMAELMECYGCSQELKAKPQQLGSGQWIAHCVSCGLTNKLTQHAEGDRFFVSGAMVVVKRD